MARKGDKSMRGRPEKYSELKIPVSLALTRTAVSNLDAMAKAINLSRSEFVEQIARGLIELSLEREND